ncbi:hypothetical protein [Rhodococcus sp. 24CO]|uniref:hypothetical protein n=1 Tax=Rhodococcus sp. 24CO TaxID=3117460 RepID=UPI003D350EE6
MPGALPSAPGTVRVQEILLRAAEARGVADFGGGDVFGGLDRNLGRSRAQRMLLRC